MLVALVLIVLGASSAYGEAADTPACWHQPHGQTRILIAYYSKGGHTEALAGAVASGAAAVPGTCVWKMSVVGAGTQMLSAADAIVLGSPVYNANPAAAMLQWIEAWPFAGEPLKDKLGAAFVTSGGMSAGEEGTLTALLRTMLGFGMVVTGGDSWQAALGASAVFEEEPFAGAPLHEHFSHKAQALGQRIARLANWMRRAAPVSTPRSADVGGIDDDSGAR